MNVTIPPRDQWVVVISHAGAGTFAARFAISEQKSSGSWKERRRFALPRLLAAAAADSLFVLSLLPPSFVGLLGRTMEWRDGRRARTRRHVQLSRPAGPLLSLGN